MKPTKWPKSPRGRDKQKGQKLSGEQLQHVKTKNNKTDSILSRELSPKKKKKKKESVLNLSERQQTPITGMTSLKQTKTKQNLFFQITMIQGIT